MKTDPMNDHDLLIIVNESVNSLKEEVKNMREQVTSTVLDHEARLRLVEKAIDRGEGALKVVYALLTLIALTLGALWWVHK